MKTFILLISILSNLAIAQSDFTELKNDEWVSLFRTNLGFKASILGYNRTLSQKRYALGYDTNINFNYLDDQYDEFNVGIKLSPMYDLIEDKNTLLGIGVHLAFNYRALNQDMLLEQIKIANPEDFPISSQANLNYGIMIKFVDENGNYVNLDSNLIENIFSNHASTQTNLKARLCFGKNNYAKVSCSVNDLIFSNKNGNQTLDINQEQFKLEIGKEFLQSMLTVGAEVGYVHTATTPSAGQSVNNSSPYFGLGITIQGLR